MQNNVIALCANRTNHNQPDPHFDHSEIQVGRRISTNLYGRGRGTIFAIHGEQRPDTLRSLGGLRSAGGNAKFDIVFDHGSKSLNLPEGVLRGVQWKILDEVVDETFINNALANANAQEIDQAAKKIAEDEAYASAVVVLRTDSQYAHLTQGSDQHSGKLAAENIRKMLKHQFPKMKFSVRKSNYGTLNINWTDGPTVADVDAIAKLFESSSFDGMQDMKTYLKKPFCQVFGGADYVFTHRDYSEAMIQKVIDGLYQDRPADLPKEKVTVEDFQKGRLFIVNMAGPDRNLQGVIRSTLNKSAG